ncbi:unnamed protein product [Meloidogyne enterolobii]|uniref:Uncharacterized protein n=1 Tax=Meloidogyne enterolobii TaxID=390850 RepID=A0ACB1AGJ3_MELEN
MHLRRGTSILHFCPTLLTNFPGSHNVFPFLFVFLTNTSSLLANRLLLCHLLGVSSFLNIFFFQNGLSSFFKNG